MFWLSFVEWNLVLLWIGCNWSSVIYIVWNGDYMCYSYLWKCCTYEWAFCQREILSPFCSNSLISPLYGVCYSFNFHLQDYDIMEESRFVGEGFGLEVEIDTESNFGLWREITPSSGVRLILHQPTNYPMITSQGHALGEFKWSWYWSSMANIHGYFNSLTFVNHKI